MTVGSREEGHTSDSDGQLVVKYGNSYEGQPGPTSIKEAFSRVTGKEWDDSPYTRHSLKVFYLERGGMYSNLAISFNMPTYKTITVEKEVEGLTEAQLERYNDEYFYYQVKIKGSTGNALVPYDDIYGVLTRPATEDELEDWVKEYTTVDGKQVYVGGHWKEGTNHGNTETINKDDEIVRWHIRVHNGIIRIKPGWKFTIEELGLNDQFTIAELYGYDPSYVFEDGEEDAPQTEDLMEDFFAPTAWYSYTEDLKDPTAIEFYDIEEPLELTEVTTPAPKAWISETKDLQYSDHILFTNTMPTKLEVEKVWTDSDTVNHSEDEITYKLYRIPYRIVDNPDYDPDYNPAEIPGDNPDEPLHPEKLSKTKRVPQPIQEVRPVDETHHEEDSTVDTAYVSMDGFTGTLPIIDSSNNTISWKETISNLPTVGWYLHEDDQNRIRVLYDYYVSEVSATEGYKHSITGGLITGDESQAEHEGEYKYTITNEPVSPIDKFTDIDIEKEWLDAEGNREDGLNLHKDDTITFELTQKKYQAMAAVDAGGGQKENKVLYPITINLYDEDGNPDNDRVKDTVVVYVPEGASFTIEPLYDNSSDSNHVVAVGGTDIEVDPNSNTSTATWQYNKPDPPYPPSNIYYYSGVRFNIDNVDSAKEVTLWLHAGHDEWVYLYDDYDPDGSPYDRINYLNKDEEPGDHPEPHYHAWTCQLYCSDKVIWDLEEVYYHIVEQEDAYVIDNDNKPVVTDPKPKYEMKLKKNDDNEYTTQILPEINAPGSGGLTDPAQIWKGSIRDLPLYELIEKDETVETYIYTYEIVEKTIGSDGVVVAPVHGTETTGGEPDPVLYNGEPSQYLVKWEEQTDGTLKFTNKKKETTEVSATKAWVNPDGEPMVPPQNATVTFELFADGVATGKTVVLDGTTVQSQIAAQLEEQIAAINVSEMTPEEKAEAIAEAQAEAESALAAWTYGELTTAWKAEWKDLPKYKYVVIDETPEEPSGDTPDETEEEPVKEPVEIEYTVKETVTYPGYVEVDADENYAEVDPETFSVTNGGTITNKQLKYSLKIVKVDAYNTETGLSGARFQLTRKLPGESEFTKFEHDSFEVDSTNANKRTGPFTVSSTEGIVLEGLIPGEYKIEEKTAPDGYIITLEPFTFTLNGDGTVTPSDTSSVLVVPLLKDNNNPAGLQIGNEPGAALPHTGGHGTRLFTILGSILFAGAGLLLLRRRRTI